MRLTAEAPHLEEAVAGIERIAQRRRRLRRPRKPSMRLFQASQASLSASFRAAAARCAEIRTSVPYIRSRDFVLMGEENAPA